MNTTGGKPGHTAEVVQMSYPGGKNGMWVAICACGDYRSSPGSKHSATRAHEDHRKAREGTE